MHFSVEMTFVNFDKMWWNYNSVTVCKYLTIPLYWNFIFFNKLSSDNNNYKTFINCLRDII